MSQSGNPGDQGRESQRRDFWSRLSAALEARAMRIPPAVPHPSMRPWIQELTPEQVQQARFLGERDRRWRQEQYDVDWSQIDEISQDLRVSHERIRRDRLLGGMEGYITQQDRGDLAFGLDRRHVDQLVHAFYLEIGVLCALPPEEFCSPETNPRISDSIVSLLRSLYDRRSISSEVNVASWIASKQDYERQVERELHTLRQCTEGLRLLHGNWDYYANPYNSREAFLSDIQGSQQRLASLAVSLVRIENTIAASRLQQARSFFADQVAPTWGGLQNTVAVASKVIGDRNCAFNAMSAQLRCAVNPSGPCEGCKHFEAKA